MTGRVLIIDDNEELAENLAEILEDEGVCAVVASSGSEGLKVLEREAVDAVLTDMRMPEMTGLEVVRRVKERWPHVPVVVMTAYARDEMLESALREGALEILAKPVDFDRLLELARRLAGGSAGRRVLVLEDDADMRTAIVEVLQAQTGVVPTPVATLGTARSIVARMQVDAAVVDVRLPDGSGLDFAAELRDAAPETEVVFITGFRDDFERTLDERLSGPGVHLLEKPFRVEELLAVLGGGT